jgi:hypothetical protein
VEPERERPSPGRPYLSPPDHWSGAGTDTAAEVRRTELEHSDASAAGHTPAVLSYDSETVFAVHS